ncbi:MAG: DUF2330 domain-containing protein [Bdellovibrionota bacterium]
MQTIQFFLFIVLLCIPHWGYAFCGFYVAKADASLFNKASQVAYVRHENRTVISMMNDYQGEMKDFALVIPVPSVLSEKQIHVGEKALFDRLDAFTAPRLVEYFDADPCQQVVYEQMMRQSVMEAGDLATTARSKSNKSLGVKIEAAYTIGEYNILILSAKQSDGLETWLTQSGYKLPQGASQALKPYIALGMKFFVAKVNLSKQSKTGLSYLRPLQIAFESEKFMLPIRLGTLNAKGKQDIIAYMLTKNGRVETTNYRTTELPTDLDLPIFVKDEFALFYQDMFATQAKKEKYRTVFTEYFWNMGWCDPCAADPLTPTELRKLGVFWVNAPVSKKLAPRILQRQPAMGQMINQPVQVMVTRLHLRYDNNTFPEDLFFQETKDQNNFQARYVLRHPFKGNPNQCDAARDYYENVLPLRQDNEAQNLARLTGWDINDIRKKAGYTDMPKPTPWWETLWN